MTEHVNTVRIGDDPWGRWMNVPWNTNPSYIAAQSLNSFDPGWSARTNLKSIADAPRVKHEAPKTVLAAGAAGGEKPGALAQDHHDHQHAGATNWCRR